MILLHLCSNIPFKIIFFFFQGRSSKNKTVTFSSFVARYETAELFQKSQFQPKTLLFENFAIKTFFQMFQDPPKLNGNVWKDYTKQNYQNFEAYPYLKWDFFMEILFVGSIVSLSLQPVSSALGGTSCTCLNLMKISYLYSPWACLLKLRIGSNVYCMNTTKISMNMSTIN